MLKNLIKTHRNIDLMILKKGNQKGTRFSHVVLITILPSGHKNKHELHELPLIFVRKINFTN
jgi:hypothetical protein